MELEYGHGRTSCSITVRGRAVRDMQRGQTAQKANTYLGDFWTSQPEQVLKLSLTVSFHNFKSQNFKLSVSNPKSKYVAYLSVLSQISNCQSLGRKNKHDNFEN